MIKLKDLLPEGNNESITEAILDDFQYERQKLLTVLRDLTYRVEHAHSPHEAGASGHDPKKEKVAIEAVRQFKTKVSHLGMDWRRLQSKLT